MAAIIFLSAVTVVLLIYMIFENKSVKTNEYMNFEKEMKL